MHLCYCLLIDSSKGVDSWIYVLLNISQAGVENSEKIFTELISSMEKRRAELSEVTRAQEKAEASKVEELILTLKQEISDLRKRHDELGKLSQIKDDIYVIQVTELTISTSCMHAQSAQMCLYRLKKCSYVYKRKNLMQHLVIMHTFGNTLQ